MKYLSCISTEFIKFAREKMWWSDKKFRHPDTNNFVQFKSLPLEEQKRLNALHDKKINETKDKDKKRLERLQNKDDRKKQKEEKRLERQKRQEAFKNMTPETHPNFFTHDGKRLNTVRGFLPNVKVEINPDWTTEKDNTYYAKQINPKNGRPLHFYTEDYIKKHEKIKFANNERFNALLPKIRQKYTEDLNGDDPRNKVYATAVALVDKAAMRIGNKKSEEDDVRGLHNLQKQHMSINGNKITIAYTGKKKVSQKHEFEVDNVLKDNIQDLLKNKKSEDPIFTWEKNGESIRIAPTYVNRYLRYRLGSNVTIHHFRHHHGSMIAKQYLDKIDAVKLNDDQMKQAIKDAAITVSDFLGNTPAVAKKHYIDPTVFEEFYAKRGKKMKVASSNKIKTASTFTFKVDTSSTDLTDQEQKFGDDLWAIKLEDLQPYEDIE